jgi:hypothetical protein
MDAASEPRSFCTDIMILPVAIYRGQGICGSITTHLVAGASQHYIGHSLDTDAVNPAKLLILLARPTGFEPVLPP